jgi:hypothetical protein
LIALLCILALIYFAFIKKAKIAIHQGNVVDGKEQENKTLNEKAVHSTPEKNVLDFKPNIKEESKLEETNIGIKARIYAISGPLEGNSIDLDENSLVIGRDPRSCKLVFPQECIEIGRKHCIVSYDEEKQVFIIEDCSSTNGTFAADGTRIAAGEKIYLKSGGSFYLSNNRYLFEVWLE